MNRYLAGAGVAALSLIAVSAAHAFPAVGNDTSGPGITITYAANGSISTSSSGQGPYDGNEDAYIGVINNSGHVINFINLSSTVCIGCFDGDGINSASYLNIAGDPTGYGGPNGSFTNNTGNTLTVNFGNGGIAANGGTDYFSLEDLVSVSQLGVPEPATWALMLIGIGGIGYAARRRAAKTATVAI